MITGNQIRAARALVGLDQEGLAAAAGVTPQTLGRIEAAGADQVPGRACTLDALVAALGERGVAIVPGGVMLAAKPVGSPLVSPARSAAEVAAGPE
jgi:transcriptional regulator with XRE-family HTH domain